MRRKLVSTVLLCTMGVGMLSGCGSTGTAADMQKSDTNATSQSADASAAASDDFSSPLKISAWVHTDDNNDGYLANTNENPVISYLSKKFNVTFDWQIPAVGSETEQLNLMLGSGDYTDVFDTTFSQQTCQELYDSGVIQDLTPYVEKYMPNYTKYINSNETVKKSAYTDDGKIVYIPDAKNEPTANWGGLMYNRKLLENVTGGKISFPSGKDEPTTIDDWDYMLGLMKQYYDQKGLKDYACLILPAAGYFTTGDILTGFGTTGSYYVDAQKKVQSGILTDQFYNYLVKMKDWYQKGYIYQDFASRSSDPFYFPNQALTYSGSAGIFYGLDAQLGTAMSSKDNGIDVDYHALTAPLDTQNNATALPANGMVNTNEASDVFGAGWVVSSSCSEEKLIRWLKLCDYLFSDEGSMMKSYGLTKEQAGDNAIYKKLGMQDGAYWFDADGNFTYNPVSDPFAASVKVKENQLRIARFPGMTNNTYYNQKTSDTLKDADKIWISNGYSACIPAGVTLTTQESKDLAPLSTAATDYIDSMVPKFIMGTEKLDKDSFAQFEDKVRSLGMDQCLKIEQTAYDRYMTK
ncbi:MAG: extracellular solute-binding protein [Butyrivibrio sp.]|nr:extracellular solute-binding protein [Butyrivibrio sp.]